MGTRTRAGRAGSITGLSRDMADAKKRKKMMEEVKKRKLESD